VWASWHYLGGYPVLDVLASLGQADALGGRERYGVQRADIGEVLAHGEYGALALTIGQLVGFGQQGQYRAAGGGDEIGQTPVKFGDAAAYIDQEHDAGQ